MKSPAQFLDHSVKRNLPQWEASPPKKKKLDVTEEDQDLETKSKPDISLFLIDTRFSRDEFDSTIESEEECVVDPLEASDTKLNIDSTVESSDEEEEKEDLDQAEKEEILAPLEDSNKNFEIFLSELQQSIESEESNDGYPPAVSPSQYPIKECRVKCRKVDGAFKDEVKEEEEDDDDEIEILDVPSCPQCKLSLQSVSTFSPGEGCSEAEVVANKEINLINLETARTEGWPFCLQTSNLTVYDSQNHMLSFEKVRGL